MERDFELEYKELKQSETPDLWNRIEAGLSEKKIATVPFEENRDAYLERFTVKKQTPWKRWGILAAACLCVVIVLPAMMISLTNFSKSSSSADTASPAKESADGFAGGAEAGSDMAASTEDRVAGDAAAEPEAVSPDSMTLELTDGQILEDVVVQILSADTADEREIYMVTVKEPDADSILVEEMQIGILCDADSEYGFPRGTRDETALKVGKIYAVTLRYDKEYEQDESVENNGNPVFYAVVVDSVEH